MSKVNLIVNDITDRESFNYLIIWHERLKNENYTLIIGVVIGNKVDKA